MRTHPFCGESEEAHGVGGDIAALCLESVATLDADLAAELLGSIQLSGGNTGRFEAGLRDALREVRQATVMEDLEDPEEPTLFFLPVHMERHPGLVTGGARRCGPGCTRVCAV